MSYQQTTNTSTARTFAKGCGIALLIMVALVGALAYGAWQLFKNVTSDGNWTIKLGDKVERSFGKGLVTAHFTLNGSQDGSKNTSTDLNSYSDGFKSLKSECVSPIASAVPKQASLWTTPTAEQHQAINTRLNTLKKNLSQKFASDLKVDAKEHLVASLNVKTGVLCVAEFSEGLPLK